MNIKYKFGEFNIFVKDDILYFSVLSDNLGIEHLTSAIIVDDNDELITLLPEFKDKIDSKQFSSEIGKGILVKLPVIFKFKTIEISGQIEFKFYEHVVGDTVYSRKYPMLSVQLFINTDDVTSDHRLYGYAPIYAQNSGKLILSELHDPRSITFYSNGWQSWSHNHLSNYREKTPTIPNRLQFFKLLKQMLENNDNSISARYFSEMHAVITDTNMDNSLIISFITHKNQFTRVLMDRIGSEGKIKYLSALSQTDSIKISELNRGLIQSEIVMLSIVTKPEAYSVLTHLQEISGKLAGMKPNNRPEAGWCSWYYYYEDIDESEFLSNVKYFDEHRDLPVNLIQLDDGYQTAIGDWGFTNDQFNNKFPNGLKYLSNRIHEFGFSSGIWVAPFLAIRGSDILKEHPEWMIRNDKNEFVRSIKNWGDINYSLDLTHPEVLKHIRELASTVANKWGYNYLKIDFIYSTAIYGSKYHDHTLSRAQVLRQGISAIRDGFGDGMILGCGAPLGPSIGLVDVMRIGEDTSSRWSYFEKIIKKLTALEELALKPALKSTIHRSYMHNTLWINDPDCVIVRQNRSKLNMDEIKLQLVVFALSGGSVIISDDEKIVEKERLDLLKRILPPYSPIKGEYGFVLPIANPLDIFKRKIPQLYSRNIVTVFGKRHLIAIINWENKKQSLSYKLGDLMNYSEMVKYSDVMVFVVYDYWAEKIITICSKNDMIRLIDIPVHGSAYLIISPVENELTFINSTLHLIPGGPEFYNIKFENNKLNIKFNKIGEQKGKITFYSEKYNQVLSENADTSIYENGFIHTVYFDDIPDEIELQFTD